MRTPRNNLNSLRSIHDDLVSVRDRISSPVTSDAPSSFLQITGRRLVFPLDEAIRVLRSLEQRGPRAEHPSSEEIETLVESQVQKSLLAAGHIKNSFTLSKSDQVQEISAESIYPQEE
jgi:hypothetical protein